MQQVPKAQKDTADLTVFLRFGDLSTKSCLQNVGEIDPRCQFHQHFTSSFFIGKCFLQLFYNYSLAL